MDEVLARALTRMPEPIEWEDKTDVKPAKTEAAAVEDDEASQLTAH
jgi:ATP-dependent Lon protease